MKIQRRTTTFAIGGGVVLAAVLLALNHRVGPPPVVHGYLRPEDPGQISRTVRHSRWEVTRMYAATHNFKGLFGLCIPDLALGRITEIGSLPDRTVDGFGLSLTNPSSCAYALSGGWYSRKLVLYGLQRTTNGWEVLSIGYK